MKRICTVASIFGITIASALAAANSTSATPSKPQIRKLRAKDVFASAKTIIFQDDFRSLALDFWNFSENDRYQLPAPPPDRIQVVDAPGLKAGSKATRFTVPYAHNSFRSEISLPHESGFQERWYGQRVLIPNEWEFDPARAADIVMQWHGIPGNWKATFPNLEISVSNDRWYIRQSFGSAQTKPTRTSTKLEERVQKGVWTSWVIHAKWSPREDGLVQIWKDGKLVMDRKGPNVYGTIGVEYTPYLKTGIYRPEWKAKPDAAPTSADQKPPQVAKKVVYVADVKIGNENAKYEDVVPRAEKQ